MSHTSQVLAETKSGGKITVWSTDKVAGISFENSKGLMNLVLEDGRFPYIDFFGNNGRGTPGAIYADEHNNLILQSGFVTGDGGHVTIISTADILHNVKNS
jgi:hypothetical protein